jgi:hypothetical protein
MKVEFYTRDAENSEGKQVPTEYVRISEFDGKAEVDRRASELDRERFSREYAAFKGAEVTAKVQVLEVPALPAPEVPALPPASEKTEE